MALLNSRFVKKLPPGLIRVLFTTRFVRGDFIEECIIDELCSGEGGDDELEFYFISDKNVATLANYLMSSSILWIMVVYIDLSPLMVVERRPR